MDCLLKILITIYGEKNPQIYLLHAIFYNILKIKSKLDDQNYPYLHLNQPQILHIMGAKIILQSYAFYKNVSIYGGGRYQVTISPKSLMLLQNLDVLIKGIQKQFKNDRQTTSPSPETFQDNNHPPSPKKFVCIPNRDLFAFQREISGI